MQHTSSIRWSDQRRVLIVPGNYQQTLQFCVQSWVRACQFAIKEHGFFLRSTLGW